MFVWFFELWLKNADLHRLGTQARDTERKRGSLVAFDWDPTFACGLAWRFNKIELVGVWRSGCA